MNASHMRARTVIFFSILLFTPLAHAQRASVAPANLEYLAEKAETIVRGHVVSAILEPDPQFSNLQTVVVTIAVTKTFKGRATPQVTFRQFVWDSGEQFKAGGYHKSEEVLLFLNPVSDYGLTSPVGIEQGLFRVLHDDKGNRYALNGRGNVGLFSGVLTRTTANGVKLSAQARAMLTRTAAGKVSLEALEEVIQALIEGRS